MELIIDTINAYDKECHGCQRHNRDVMIAITQENEPVEHAVHDLFLTQAQAEKLLQSLTKVVNSNKNG